MCEEIIKATIEEIKINALRFKMDDVSNRLSISKKTLYKYFPSKVILIDSVIASIMIDYDIKEERILHMDLEVNDKISMLLQIYSDSFWHFDRELYKDLRHDYADQWDRWTNYRDSKLATMNDLLKDAINDGYFKDIRPDFITHCLGFVIDGLIESEYLKEKNIKFNDALRTFIEILVNGMRL